MLKLKNDALRMTLLLVVVGCTSAVCQSRSYLASGVDNAASPDWQTPGRRDYFTLREADHYANNWKEPRSILMSKRIELPISDGQPYAIIGVGVNSTRASSGV